MLTRRSAPCEIRAATPTEHGFRFVPKVDEGRMRGRAHLVVRRRRARLTALSQALLAQVALDRERGAAP